jgi:hypothetical protein
MPEPEPSIAASPVVKRLPAKVRAVVLACTAELAVLPDERDRRLAVAVLALATKALLCPDGERVQ